MASDDYTDMTYDDFVRLVTIIVKRIGVASLIMIPGVWEILSEHYNDDAFDLWTAEQEANDDVPSSS